MDDSGTEFDYNVIFCGGGPAAIGPLVASARDHRLAELLERGVLLIERSDRIGPGSMGHYRIAANSFGGAFLECLDTTPPELFTSVRAAKATEDLRRLSDTNPPLGVVAAFLGELGAAVHELLDAHPRCAVETRAAVTEIRLLAEGGVRVRAERSGGGFVEATARKAVVAMGGVEPTDSRAVELLPGVSLDGLRDKVWHASAVIDTSQGFPDDLTGALGDNRRVVIVGGSHSAWSAAWVLLTDPAFNPPNRAPLEVTIVHRTPIRLFYLSEEAAAEDGYSFDPRLDVCELSGRVNRYGGLRGDAYLLARRALGLGGEGPKVGLVDLGRDGPDVVRAALADAGAVISAIGYHARLPHISTSDGDSVVLAASPTGLVVTEDARVVDVDGNVIPEIVAYGLGAGLASSAAIGGEKSYARRADGVWLYQNDVGEVALRSLFDEEPQGGSPPARRAPASVEAVPL